MKGLEYRAYALGFLVFLTTIFEVSLMVPMGLSMKIAFQTNLSSVEVSILDHIYKDFGINPTGFILISWLFVAISLLVGFVTQVFLQKLLWSSHRKILLRLASNISQIKYWNDFIDSASRYKKTVLTEAQNYCMYWLVSMSNLIGRGGFILLASCSVIWYFGSVIDWTKVAIISGIVIPVLFIGVYSIYRYFNIVGAHREFEGRLIFSKVDSLFHNIPIIQILSRNSVFISDLSVPVKRFEKASLVFGIVPQIPRLVIEFIVFTAILISAYMLASGKTIDTAAIYISVVIIRVLPSINTLIKNLAELGIGRAARREIKNTLEEIKFSKHNQPTEFEDKPIEDQSIMGTHEVEHKNRAYRLDIREEHLILIKGASGSGKSTFLRSLLGADKDVCVFPTTDRIIDLSCLENLGYVPQEVQLINGTVYENVAFGENIDTKAIDDILRSVSLNVFIGNYELLSSFGGGVSGGEKQRLGLARCLYARSKIIFMDEPTSALDEITELNFVDLIATLLKRKMTFVIVTHGKMFDHLASQTIQITTGDEK